MKPESDSTYSASADLTASIEYAYSELRRRKAAEGGCWSDYRPPWASTSIRSTHMYLTLFFDVANYEFNVSLHSSLAAAEADYVDMLRYFDVKRDDDGMLCDDHGEAPHVYRIECDGGVGEKIPMPDLAAA